MVSAFLPPRQTATALTAPCVSDFAPATLPANASFGRCHRIEAVVSCRILHAAKVLRPVGRSSG
jgi:hypothetical protein